MNLFEQFNYVLHRLQKLGSQRASSKAVITDTKWGLNSLQHYTTADNMGDLWSDRSKALGSESRQDVHWFVPFIDSILYQ